MGLNHFGIFGPQFYENEEEKAGTIRTENYIGLLRGKVTPLLKRENILNS